MTDAAQGVARLVTYFTLLLYPTLPPYYFTLLYLTTLPYFTGHSLGHYFTLLLFSFTANSNQILAL